MLFNLLNPERDREERAGRRVLRRRRQLKVGRTERFTTLKVPGKYPLVCLAKIYIGENVKIWEMKKHREGDCVTSNWETTLCHCWRER
jgi:hypothetical protein